MKTATNPLSLVIFVIAAALICLFCQSARNVCLAQYGRATYPDFVGVTKYGAIVEGRNAHTLDGRHYDGIIPPFGGPIDVVRTTGTTKDGQTICPDDMPPVSGTVDPGWKTESGVWLTRSL